MKSVQKAAGTQAKSLMGMLSDKDGLRRQSARESLVALGGSAVPPLVEALRNSKSDQVRWEAAKALGAIGDSRSAQVLVEALEDHDSDVTWLAAEALNKMGKAAWPTLLQALIASEPDNVTLRQGLHHVLSNQHAEGFNDLLATLRNALEMGEIPEEAPKVAYEILRRMKANP